MARKKNVVEETGQMDPVAFIKAVKTISGDMAFPNSNNNSYLTAQSNDKNIWQTMPLHTMPDLHPHIAL